MKKAFGQPKPLPGQAGYKVSNTEVLENEAKEMESRLKLLQERMEQQLLEDSSKPRVGGARWKSARTDKGSVTSYAKDVQETHRKKFAEGEDPATRQPKKKSDKSSKQPTGVNGWSARDVGNWLSSINLPQYSDVFIQNEITGPILFDISLEDLDYMGITILGHRKSIINGIEELRICQSNVTKISERSSEEGKILRSASEELESRGGKVHWTHVEPLSMNKVSNEAPQVNPADGVLDEEAERAAFQKAVMEWRQGNKPKASLPSSETSLIVNDDQDRENRTIRSDFGGLESLGNGEMNEAAEKEAFRKAVVEWRGLGDGRVRVVREYQNEASIGDLKPAADEGMWKNPWGGAPPVESTAVGSGNETGLPYDGPLDEAREREAFQKAVEAWRNGTNLPSSAIVNMTEKLRKDLEDEETESLRRLQVEKDDAFKRLAELESVRLQNARKHVAEEFSDDLSEQEETDLNSENDQADQSSFSCSRVEFALVCSEMLRDGVTSNGDGEGEYTVEEISDED